MLAIDAEFLVVRRHSVQPPKKRGPRQRGRSRRGPLPPLDFRQPHGLTPVQLPSLGERGSLEGVIWYAVTNLYDPFSHCALSTN